MGAGHGGAKSVSAGAIVGPSSGETAAAGPSDGTPSATAGSALTASSGRSFSSGLLAVLVSLLAASERSWGAVMLNPMVATRWAWAQRRMTRRQWLSRVAEPLDISALRLSGMRSADKESCNHPYSEGDLLGIAGISASRPEGQNQHGPPPGAQFRRARCGTGRHARAWNACGIAVDILVIGDECCRARSIVPLPSEKPFAG